MILDYKYYSRDYRDSRNADNHEQELVEKLAVKNVVGNFGAAVHLGRSRFGDSHLRQLAGYCLVFQGVVVGIALSRRILGAFELKAFERFSVGGHTERRFAYPF